MHGVSYLVIVIAALAQWILGAIWYGLIFRKSWKTLTGCTESEKPGKRVFAMITSFVACLLLSYVLWWFLNLLTHLATVAKLPAPTSFTAGLDIGGICWLGFIAPPLLAQHVYERRRANLFVINAAYWMLAMALAGGILAACH